MEKKRFSKVAHNSSQGQRFSKKEPKSGLSIYGIHPVLAALAFPQTVSQLVIQAGLTSQAMMKIRDRAKAQSIDIREVSKQELDQLLPQVTHQGVSAQVQEGALYKDLDVLEHKSFVLVLDHLEDPQNLGAILRSAHLLGVDGVVIPKHRSVGLTSSVLKVSSGAALNIPIIQHSSLTFALEKLKSWGYWIYSMDMEAQTPLPSVEWTDKIVVIMGNESRGVSEILSKQSDFLISIPIYPSKIVDSLNVSVAAGICLYEIAKSRKSHTSP